MQSTASQWNGSFFVFLFLFCFLFLFLFFFFFFVFLFVCLFDSFNHLVQALNWFQKEPPCKVNMVNAMKLSFLYRERVWSSGTEHDS